MNTAFNIFKYCIHDLRRSIWILFYPIFFIATSLSFIYFTGDSSKAVIGTMNFSILIIPLIGSVSGVMYYYNSRELIQILLAMPIKRSKIIFSILVSHTSMLTIGFLIGILPLIFTATSNESLAGLGLLALCGVFLTLIFSAVSFYLGILFDDRIKGFGWTILFWLCVAILYDGLILSIIVFFKEYPLEKLSIFLSMLNPIDLTRIMVLLNFESASILGYTGAVFKKFFGTSIGIITAILSLIFWYSTIILLIKLKIQRKDF